MHMISDWQAILKKAWSVRLMIIAGLLSGCEIILPLYADSLPRHLFASLSMIVITAALIARLVAQKGLSE